MVKKPTPFLRPAMEKAMKASGAPVASSGTFVRADLEPYLEELFKRTFPSFAGKGLKFGFTNAMPDPIPYGTIMRRSDSPFSVGQPYQRGMALGPHCGVLCFDSNLPSFTSGWEIDPEAET